MPKNIAVFSDGTGQDGGVRPEQRMSNVFNRAARPGPDNSVDALRQVAFYDPGLGTDENAGTSENMIRAVVDRFYARAREDELVGSVFKAAVPDERWQVHLDTIALGRARGRAPAKSRHFIDGLWIPPLHA